MSSLDPDNKFHAWEVAWMALGVFVAVALGGAILAAIVGRIFNGQ